MRPKVRFFVLLKIVFILLISQAAWAALKPPDPVILIHGINSGPEVWDSFVNRMAVEYGWQYGGTLTVRYHIVEEIFTSARQPSQTADVYAVRFPDRGLNNKTFFEQAEDLEIAVNYVLAVTQARKVILVGHSMGGLTARAFVNSSLVNAKKVSQIITVGTPHLGANFASLLEVHSLEFTSRAVRALEPDSPDLNRLNGFDYFDKAIAFASIVVENDLVVPAQSQNLINANSSLLSHQITRVPGRGCISIHICEIQDLEIQSKIIEKIFNQPLVINLRLVSTPTIWMPYMALQLTLETNREVTGDLYVAVVNSNSRLFFLQSPVNPLWDTDNQRVLMRVIPQGDFYVINYLMTNDLYYWPIGWQFFYALVTQPEATNIFDQSQWLSNLSGPVRLGISHN